MFSTPRPKMSKRYSPADASRQALNATTLRILRVLRRLQQGPATIKELAELGNVDLRTTRRDVAAICAAGYTLLDRTEEFGRKRFRIKKD